jgi:Pentapeptide repeats (8 copies)
VRATGIQAKPRWGWGWHFWTLIAVIVLAGAVSVALLRGGEVVWLIFMAWWRVLVAGAAVAGAVVVIFAAWWFWWMLPKLQVARLRFAIRDPKARADVEDNFRKTTGQLLGGAAVLFGAGFAYLQFTQQLQASHDVLISNQVSKGFEQLGSDKVPVRLGGIYALEGVMNNSEQYHQPVLEALCAFVRNETQPEASDAPPQKTQPKASNVSPPGKAVPRAPATEVQAALTVIARRKAGAGGIDLFRSHIPKAALVEANLRGAYLSEADLSGATLVKANLEFAILGDATLVDAALVDANLTHADLSGADLERALLGGAQLESAILFGANLNGTYLSEADLSGALLDRANLSGADLTGAKNLTKEQLDTACGDNETKLDPPLKIKPCPQQ